VTTLDWLIVAFAAVGAISGAMRGFVAGALSLAGFAGGAFVGARLAPLLLSGGSASPYAPLFALIGALVLGLALAGLLQGVGGAVMGGVRLPVARTVDAALGALLGAAIALTLVWVAGAAALHTPGADSLRADVQRSSILQALNDALPPSGPLLRALARFDPLPVIAGPAPSGIERPSQEALSRPGVRAAVDGTVRVLAAACGLGISGSGWIARPGVIVTNAHVVAGTGGDISVQLRGTGQRHDARVVYFDPRGDIAILAAPQVGGSPLRVVRDPQSGTAGAILGYPENGPFDSRAARIGATQQVFSQDIYGRGPIRRSMTSIRGRIRHGNSGGPVVDGDGRVLATVFASAEDTSASGGFGVPNALVRAALRRAGAGSQSASTGECAA
jgi:S1-C subfamily serine protease